MKKEIQKNKMKMGMSLMKNTVKEIQKVINMIEQYQIMENSGDEIKQAVAEVVPSSRLV